MLLLELVMQLLAFRNVLVRNEAAAIRHAAARHADDAPVRQLLDARRHLAEIADPTVDEALGIADMIEAVGNAILQDLADGSAGFHLLRRQTVHVGIALVADDEALLGIEHGNALQHILQRRIELFMLLRQAGVELLTLLRCRMPLA